MKSLILIHSFLRKNIVPILIIIAVMSVSLFFLVPAYGSYRFVTAVRDMYVDAGFENVVYFMYSFDSSKEDPFDAMNNGCREEISSLAACEEIIEPYSSYGYCDDQCINTKLYSDTLIKSFPLDVDKGRWLRPDSDRLEAVVCNYDNFDNVRVGDTLTLKEGVDATVVGVLEGKFYLPYFGHGGTSTSADSLFNTEEYFAIVNMKALSENDLNEISPRRGMNYYVRVSSSATEAEKAELLEKLSAYGRYEDYDSIMKFTNARVEKRLRELLPLPVFLLIITSVLTVCITALTIKKSMSEFSCYFLIGCSKQKSFMLISSALSAVFSIPCLINAASVIFFPSFLRGDHGVFSGEYINGDCIIPIIIFFFVNVFITIIIPLIYYRRFSPLDFHRRNI